MRVYHCFTAVTKTFVSLGMRVLDLIVIWTWIYMIKLLVNVPWTPNRASDFWTCYLDALNNVGTYMIEDTCRDFAYEPLLTSGIGTTWHYCLGKYPDWPLTDWPGSCCIVYFDFFFPNEEWKRSQCHWYRTTNGTLRSTLFVNDSKAIGHFTSSPCSYLHGHRTLYPLLCSPEIQFSL